MKMNSDIRKAVSAFAKAVRMTLDLYDIPEPDNMTYYHAVEYSKDMEDLLMEMLLTASDDASERDEILKCNNLDHLCEDLHLKAAEWEK